MGAMLVDQITVQVHLKTLSPAGTCCFCIPIKQGAMTIAVLAAISSLIGCILSVNAFDLVLNLVVSIICFGGAGIVFYGHYRYVSMYAVAYAITECVSAILTFVLIGSVDCGTADTLSQASSCQSYKTSTMLTCAFMFVLNAYFIYVTFEYAIKLRKLVSQTFNMPLGTLF